MFQRFSFSPFSTFSPPQTKGSPRNFTSRLFTWGKASSYTISSPPNSSADGSDPAQEGHLGTSHLKELSPREQGGHGEAVEARGTNSYKDTRTEPDGRSHGLEVDSNNDTDDELLYEAESPDEAALVHAARAYHCTLRGRSTESLLVDLPGIGSLAVQLLHVLPFDSNRKRMSVVVRHPLTGHVVVYTKGADSVIMDLSETPEGNLQQEHEQRASMHSTD